MLDIPKDSIVPGFVFVEAHETTVTFRCQYSSITHTCPRDDRGRLLCGVAFSLSSSFCQWKRKVPNEKGGYCEEVAPAAHTLLWVKRYDRSTW